MPRFIVLILLAVWASWAIADDNARRGMHSTPR
jgi:hypothetical protein